MTPPQDPRSPEEELFRDALTRTADTLSPLPDLVHDAVREGQRRRARSRGFAVAGAFVAVTSVTLGIALLGPLVRPTPETEPAAPPPSPSLTRPVPSLSPTRPTPGFSPTRPTPEPAPDPTEPVTGMPIPASPPTPTPTSPPWSTPPTTPSGAPPATPEPARSAAEPFAPSPDPGATP